MSLKKNSNHKIYRTREINNLLPEGFAMCFVYNPQKYINAPSMSKIEPHWKHHLYHAGKHVCIEEHAFFKVGTIPDIFSLKEELNYNFKGKYLYVQKSPSTVCKIIRQGKTLAEYKLLKKALNTYITPLLYSIPGKDSINLYQFSIITELARAVEAVVAGKNGQIGG